MSAYQGQQHMPILKTKLHRLRDPADSLEADGKEF
jgi:hypothetical protein